MIALTSDELRHLAPDHPARLLMIAHGRLSSRPVAANAIKSIMVAAYGEYVVRLIVFGPGSIAYSVASLWVELHDTCNNRTLDGAGCNDLSEGLAAAEEFLAEAKMLNTCSNRPAP
jgi:hypothetical protein